MGTNPKMAVFFDRLEQITESYLTRRRRLRRIKKEKQRAKNPVLDWIEAILWAAGMVLLINQYLMQAYQIPTGSMIDSLNIGDHVIVNKLVYGPELLPGVLKLPSVIEPKRNDIIVFENPTYISRGPVFDIAQRVIYMLTFSLVDIDRDEKGAQRVHFLIKRAAGSAGDRFIMDKGDMKIRFSGEDRWVYEKDYVKERGWNHNLSRMVNMNDYPAIEAAGYAVAWTDMQLPVPDELLEAYSGIGNIRNPDYLAYEQARLEMLRRLSPGDKRYATQYSQRVLGRYVPEGRVYPLGDNRDNSNDGRNFGPVRASKVLGKGFIIYWPMWRIGGIK